MSRCWVLHTVFLLAAVLGWPRALSAGELTAQQRQAFQSAKTVSVSTHLSGDAKNVESPLESLLRQLIEPTGLQVVDDPSQPHDLTLCVEAAGEARKVQIGKDQWGKPYDRNRVSWAGRIVLSAPGAGNYTERFAEAREPEADADAHFDHLLLPVYGPFVSMQWEEGNPSATIVRFPFFNIFFHMLEQVYGPQFVIAALRSKNGEIAAHAAGRLEDSQHPGLLEMLIPALKDPDPNVRGVAARALGKKGSPRTVPFLVDMLNQDDNPVVQVDAALSLKELGAVDALIGALNGNGANVALRVLERMSDQNFGRDAAKWQAWWDAQKASQSRR